VSVTAVQRLNRARLLAEHLNDLSLVSEGEAWPATRASSNCSK
jgi:hypothetical protein